MFRPDQVDCVNRDAVGGYAAGTLLVTWADEVKHRAVPWNNLPTPLGGYAPVADADGRPLFPPTDITEEQLRSVRVEEESEADPAHVVE